MFYFGYGSNMSSRVMKATCIETRLVGAAFLPDYRLAFTRVSKRWGGAAADIVASTGDVVWGVLYEIDEDCLVALNEKESLGIGYQHHHVTVSTADWRSIAALTYVVIDKLDPEGLPAIAYIDTIIEGAKENHLPGDYLVSLENIRSRVK